MARETRRVVAKATLAWNPCHRGPGRFPYVRAAKGILLRHFKNEEFGPLDSAAEHFAFGARMIRERQGLMAWNVAAIL
jgi:hypothetical protein